MASEDFFTGKTQRQAYERYFAEVLLLAESGLDRQALSSCRVLGIEVIRF